MILKSLFRSLLVAVLVSGCFAQEKEAPAPLPDGVGEALGLEQFQDLLSNSPFRRLMSFSEDLVLTGVAKLPEGTVVTVYDQRAKETYSVSANENVQGWRLIDVTGGDELDDVEARILIGKQEVMLRFDQRRLTPESIRRGRSRRVKPGQSPEKPSVEQWLAQLDTTLLKNYGELDDTYKDRFRYSFETYLEAYPNASSELRTLTARERLDAVQEQQTIERQAATKPLETLDVGSPK